jgi:hypothetical protein
MAVEAGRIARFDRHVERRQGQARLQMALERPADDLAREGVGDGGEIDEGRRQPNGGPRARTSRAGTSTSWKGRFHVGEFVVALDRA